MASENSLFVKEIKAAKEKPGFSIEKAQEIAAKHSVFLDPRLAEQLVSQSPLTKGERVQRFSENIVAGAIDTAATAVDATGGALASVAEKVGILPKLDPENRYPEVKKKLAKEYGGGLWAFAQAAEALHNAAEAVHTPELRGREPELEGQVGQAVGGTMLPIGGSAKLIKMGMKPFAAIALPSGAIGFSQNWIEAEQAGVDDEGKWVAGLGGGAGAAILEPLGGALSGPVKRIAGILSKADKKSGGALSGALLRYVKEPASEALTEAVQSVWEANLMEHVTGEERDVLAEAVEGGKLGLLTSLVLTTATGGFLPAGNIRPAEGSPPSDSPLPGAPQPEGRAGPSATPTPEGDQIDLGDERSVALARARLEDDIAAVKGGQLAPPEGVSVEERVSQLEEELGALPDVTAMEEKAEPTTREGWIERIKEGGDVPAEVIQKHPGIIQEAVGEPESLTVKAPPEEVPVPEETMAFPGSMIEDAKSALATLKEKITKTPPVSEEGMSDIAPETSDSLTRVWVDRLEPIQKFQKEEGGQTPAERQDTYLQETLRRGKTKNDLETAERNVYKPLLRKIRQAKIPVSEDTKGGPSLDSYLLARHARERNAVIQRRLRAGPARKLSKEAFQRINQVEDRLAKRVSEIRARTRTRASEARRTLKGKDLQRRLQTLELKENEALQEAGRKARLKVEDLETQLQIDLGDIEVDELMGIGMTNEEADAILAEVAAHPKRERYEEIAGDFDSINDDTRKIWVRGGLESQEYVDQLRELFPHYAPARTETGDRPRTGRGVDVRGRESASALGRRSRPDTPLAFALSMHQQALVRARKNEVGQSFARWVRENAERLTGFAEIVTEFPTKKMLVNGAIKEVPDPSFMSQDNVLAVKENGETIFVQFADEYVDVAKALKSMGSTQSMEFLNFLERYAQETHWANPGAMMASVIHKVFTGKATRGLAQLLTRYNPTFPPVNFVKDTGKAAFNSLEHGYGFAAKVARDAPRGLITITRAKVAGKRRSGKWDSYLERYEKSGAPIAYLELNTVEDIQKRIQKEIAETTGKGGTASKVKRGWRDLLTLLGEYSDAFENGSRLSAFVHAIEDLGMTDAQAAKFAKEITVNFERRGDLGNLMNTWYMFSNAHVQDLTRTGRAMKHPRVKKMLASAFVGQMVWSQMVRMLMGKDDDGEDLYDRIPDYIKETHFIIPAMGEGPEPYISIPLPWTVNFFFYAADQTSGALSGDIPFGKAVGNIASSAAQTVNPLGASSEIEQVVAPTVLDPMVQIATNRSWTGNPIMPEDYGGHTPDSERFWPDANPMAVGLSSWLNRATGGTKHKEGAISVSPESFEHLARFITGGVGNLFFRLNAMEERMVEGTTIRMDDVPLVRRFVKTHSPQRSVEDFRAAKADLEDRKDAGDAQAAYMLKDWNRVNRAINSSLKGRTEKPIAEQDELFEQANKRRLEWLKEYRSSYGGD